MSLPTTGTPRIDVSAGKLDLEMTVGDPLLFSFLVEDSADWAGAVFTVLVDDGVNLLTLDVDVTAQVDDALIVISSDTQPTLLVSRSGYAWAMKETDGPTKFAGLLFVDGSV